MGNTNQIYQKGVIRSCNKRRVYHILVRCCFFFLLPCLNISLMISFKIPNSQQLSLPSPRSCSITDDTIVGTTCTLFSFKSKQQLDICPHCEVNSTKVQLIQHKHQVWVS